MVLEVAVHLLRNLSGSLSNWASHHVRSCCGCKCSEGQWILWHLDLSDRLSLCSLYISTDRGGHNHRRGADRLVRGLARGAPPPPCLSLGVRWCLFWCLLCLSSCTLSLADGDVDNIQLVGVNFSEMNPRSAQDKSDSHLCPKWKRMNLRGCK